MSEERIDHDKEMSAFYWVNHGEYEAIVLYRTFRGQNQKTSRPTTQTFRSDTPEGLRDALVAAGWDPDADVEKIRLLCETAPASTMRRPRR